MNEILHSFGKGASIMPILIQSKRQANIVDQILVLLRYHQYQNRKKLRDDVIYSSMNTNMTVSRVRRNIYPEFTTEQHIIDDPQQEMIDQITQHFDDLSISSDDEEKYFFSNDLEEIKASYLALDFPRVIRLAKEAFQRYKESSKNDLIKKNISNLTLDLSKIRGILANAYLNLYRNQRKSIYLSKAKACLIFEYESIETPYKRAQRLNNLGLCEMLRTRYNNAFKFFSQAFHIYIQQPQLNLTGLIKNISEVYKQLEMYQEAIKYLQFVFQEFDKNNRYELNEYTCLIISTLQCINECPTSSLHLSIYQRVKQFLPKLDKERPKQQFFHAKIRLQLIKYAVQYGIEAKCITQEETQLIFNEIFNMESIESRIKFIKGQSCFVYRELFRSTNWEQFKELSRLAEVFYKSSEQE